MSILTRVASGEAGAANECITRFSGLVWSLARRFSTDAFESEDAVQEIFIDLWRSAPRYDSTIATETTFVAMIARRRLIDRGRRRQRRPDAGVLSEVAAAPMSEIDDPPAVKEEAAEAARLLGRLRPEQQLVLSMAIRRGASHEQIASTTGLPLGTVKTHSRRGLLKLRQLLADAGIHRFGDGGEAGGLRQRVRTTSNLARRPAV